MSYSINVLFKQLEFMGSTKFQFSQLRMVNSQVRITGTTYDVSKLLPYHDHFLFDPYINETQSQLTVLLHVKVNSKLKIWNTASCSVQVSNWLHLNFTTCIVHNVNTVLYFPEKYVYKMMADYSKFNQVFV